MKVLTVLVEVLDEVLLALELPRELVGIHVAERPLLGLNVIVGVHFLIVWIFMIYFWNYYL